MPYKTPKGIKAWLWGSWGFAAFYLVLFIKDVIFGHWSAFIYYVCGALMSYFIWKHYNVWKPRMDREQADWEEKRRRFYKEILRISDN